MRIIRWNDYSNKEQEKDTLESINRLIERLYIQEDEKVVKEMEKEIERNKI